MQAAIVGGGIIGLSAAYYLLQDGWQVTVLDNTDLSDGCSYGNLGMIVPSHFVPLAAPGMLTQGIRWMFNSKSPFYVKPSFDPRLFSWGIKFIKSSTRRNVQRAAVPLRDINLLSRHLYEELASAPGFAFGLEKKGILMYYKSARVEEEEGHLAEKALSLGLDVGVLNKAAVQALEPGTALDILGAVHYRCDAHLSPNLLVPQLLDFLKAAGVRFVAGEAIEKLRLHRGEIKTVSTSQRAYEADLFVFAAGSWLPQVARLAGLSIPLMPGKGYSFTLQQPAQRLNIPAILCEARVAITPMNGNMRYGGTMEIAPVNSRINLNRVAGIVASVPKYFPSMQLPMPDKKDIWFGFRPVSPDGLPYIGFSKKVRNLVIAGGHAMSGLSLGPATGKLVAELAGGRAPSVNLDFFAPDRFS